MNQYTLLGEYTLGEGKQKQTCDHCGRAIKSVYQVRDNTTGDILNIGIVCIGKVMNLNTTFEKAVVRSLKSYKKTKQCRDERINKNILESIRKCLDSNSKLDKDDYNYTEPLTIVKECIKDVWFEIRQMIQECEKLNKVSKTGLIDVNDMEYYNNKLNDFHNKFPMASGSFDWNYILENEVEIKNLLDEYNNL